ncbi:MAG TPA: hypothetical protein VEC19_02615 [Usitatibacter sp.]|nr:hypothetical protein [Usitatibacter sp.]
MTESMSATPPTPEPSNPFWVVFVGGLIVFLGFATIIGQKWPIMVTPFQLDLIAVPLTWIFGDQLGAYFSGAVCFVVGGFFVWVGLNDRRPGN